MKLTTFQSETYLFVDFENIIASVVFLFEKNPKAVFITTMQQRQYVFIGRNLKDFRKNKRTKLGNSGNGILETPSDFVSTTGALQFLIDKWQLKLTVIEYDQRILRKHKIDSTIELISITPM